MDLRTYLFKKRIKIAEFARRINYSQHHLHKILNGERHPGKKLEKIIEQATNGEVSIDELRNYDPKA